MTRTALKEQLIRLTLLLLGLVVAHLGVTLFLQADLGSDPFNVFVQGAFRALSNATGWPFLTHGRTHIGISLLIMVLLFFLDRSYVKLGTFCCMAFGGPIIDGFTALLQGIVHSGNPFPVRVAVLCLGCVILALGMTIVIKSDAGTGPNDLVAVVISDKSGKPFSIVRIVVDVCFVLLGFLLGGVFGVGTLICAFLVGPLAGVFMPYSEKLVEQVLERFLPT